VTLALILDALWGRSPLFRVHEFFEDEDVKFLVGEDIQVAKLNDDTLGRVLGCLAMERAIRMNLRASESTVTGWESRQTSQPTSLMLTTKFVGVHVLATSLGRRLNKPMTPVQLRYLQILDLSPETFLSSFPTCYNSRRLE
jgi:hypothetical protein